MPSLGPSHVRPPLGGSGVASDTTLESFFSKLHSHSSDALRRVDRFLLLAVLFCRLPSQLTRDAFPILSSPSYRSRPSSPPPPGHLPPTSASPSLHSAAGRLILTKLCDTTRHTLLHRIYAPLPGTHVMTRPQDAKGVNPKTTRQLSFLRELRPRLCTP
jgi:hypothetical protein